ncbi:exported hypothetical protein [Nitrospina gracilis 3/211]|uniref:Uncharacterized protein n=1 Tax=Nitrospina gracilis (strain 3/211) TaxID=1266370 RepID=M1YI16_NITG3|nr:MULTISPECIES: hypothetical protein [Nitrospina]MCF8723095.1 hypothetical protein [Nitrospina sp. Nb-3]CCQ90135.1 exported hypothetical protein [Nitrospina gracilis 3/211]
MFKKFAALTGMIFCFISLAAGAQAENGNESFTQKHFLIHVKTSLDEDDAQICVAPNVALAALRKGHRVTLLFDGSAVTSVKKGGWFGADQTPMDKAALPERERMTLSEQFGMDLSRIPSDYGEYLAFLKSEGADLKINRTMMLLYKIEPEDIDSNLTPIMLSEMLEIIQNADHYLVY